MSKIYYCNKGCHLTDQSKQLCPHCGGFLKETDESAKDAILEDIKRMQIEAGKDYAKGRYVNNKLT